MAWLEEFNGCCGINIITGFTEAKPSAKQKEEIIKQIKQAEDDHKYERAGLVLISLNTRQRKHLHKLITGLKYEVIVDRFYNPRHRSRISLYAKKTPRAKKAPKGQEIGWW